MTAFKIVPQSAVIPYRYEGGELRILLITSLGTKRWVLPKGHIERGLTPRESAEFEAFEEAGLSGDVEELSIGAYTYMKNKKKGGRQCRVEVFPMNFKHMVDDYPEAGLRKRKWMNLNKAIDAVNEPGLKAILERFGALQKQTADGAR